MTEKKIGLVLSGGGVKGIAHIAVIKALEERNISIDFISGSSSGAMVGALYAAGYSADEMIGFFKKNAPIFKFKNLTRVKAGILNADNYEATFKPWLENHTFESLHKKLYICVTDVLNGQVQYFSKGAIVRPLLASAVVTGIFSPVVINENWYIDGGTMNNFPIEPLLNKCEIILGSYVSPIKPVPVESINSTLKLINRATVLGINAASVQKFDQCTYVFSPLDFYNYGIFDTNNMDTIFDIGYKNAVEMIEHDVNLQSLKNLDSN